MATAFPESEPPIPGSETCRHVATDWRPILARIHAPVIWITFTIIIIIIIIIIISSYGYRPALLLMRKCDNPSGLETQGRAGGVWIWVTRQAG